MRTFDPLGFFSVSIWPSWLASRERWPCLLLAPVMLHGLPELVFLAAYNALCLSYLGESARIQGLGATLGVPPPAKPPQKCQYWRHSCDIAWRLQGLSVVSPL